MDAPAHSFGQGVLQVCRASKQPNPLLPLCHAVQGVVLQGLLLASANFKHLLS